MIVYLSARLFSWLYCYSWPLGRTPIGEHANAFLVILSIIIFPCEVYCVVMSVRNSLKDKRDKRK